MFELVLADGSRVPLLHQVTIGRARESDIRLDDPSVSRLHARLRVDGGTPAIDDAGSSYGVWVEGRRGSDSQPLHDGARIRLGEQDLVVERRRSDAEAG